MTKLIIYICISHLILVMKSTLSANVSSPDTADRLKVYFRETCPFVTGSKGPVVNISDYVKLKLLFWPVSFSSVDVSMQIFSIFGIIYSIWPLPDCAKWGNDPRWNQVPYLEYYCNNFNELIWRPQIEHLNSMNNFLPGHPSVEHAFYVFPDGTTMKSIPDQFTSRCDFGAQLRKFPYDEHDCFIHFQLWHPTAFVQITEAYYVYTYSGQPCTENCYLGKDFGFQSSVWHIEAKKVELIRIGDDSYSHVKYFFKLRRNPYNWNLNLVLPIFLLSVLQLLTFAMPPKYPDRCLFAVTVVLTLYVLSSEMTKELPMTTSIIYLSVNSHAQIALSTAIAGYAVAACVDRERATKTVRKIDVLFFLFAAIYVAITHAVTFYLMLQ